MCLSADGCDVGLCGMDSSVLPLQSNYRVIGSLKDDDCQECNFSILPTFRRYNANRSLFGGARGDGL